jgi:hypothetical protein
LAAVADPENEKFASAHATEKKNWYFAVAPLVTLDVLKLALIPGETPL